MLKIQKEKSHLQLEFFGKSDSDKLQEIIHYLCDGQQTLEVNKCIKVFKDWGNANGVNFTDEPVYGTEGDE